MFRTFFVLNEADMSSKINTNLLMQLSGNDTIQCRLPKYTKTNLLMYSKKVLKSKL
jgi:hypothetical protein